MDVNRAQAVSTVANNSKGNNGREHADKDGSEDQNDDNAHGAHEAEAAFEIGGLAGDITPAVQQLLEQLGAEVEPLRAQLKLAREREDKLRQDLAKHAFLPVPGRREFFRELNHVLNHLNDLTIMPSLVVMHVANAADVRNQHGREILDRFLIHVASTVDRLLQPTEVLGNLGGDDFALILLAENVEHARERASQIAKRVEETMLPGHAELTAPMVIVGVTELVRGASAEAVVAAADKDMLISAG